MRSIGVKDLAKKYSMMIKHSDDDEISESLLSQYLMEVAAITKTWVVIDDRNFIFNRFSTEEEALEFVKESQKPYKVVNLTLNNRQG